MYKSPESPCETEFTAIFEQHRAAIAELHKQKMEYVIPLDETINKLKAAPALMTWLERNFLGRTFQVQIQRKTKTKINGIQVKQMSTI